MSGVLGVEPNATLTEVQKAYHSKIRELDTNDSEFSNKFESLTQAYNGLVDRAKRAKRDEIAGYRHNHSLFSDDDMFGFGLVDRSFFRNPFRAFENVHNRIEKFMSHLDHLDETDPDIKEYLDDEKNYQEVETDAPYEGYKKYVSSYTTINNGKRESKTVSRVEKIKDGKKRISQVSKIQDGDKVTIQKLGDKNQERLEDKQ
uniref:J domain-containing protein n=1 Tax=viral metagenome TaxID=1070528 RepID=A0A6C0EBS8_9ZZZZ